MTYEHLNHEAVLFFWLSNLIFRLFKKFLKHNNTSTKPLESDYSNAKLEAKNMLSKDIKRQGFGFQNF